MTLGHYFIKLLLYLQNGHHQKLRTTDSPTISACTTATNLSSLGDFQSSSTINRKMSVFGENLKNTIHEIEPLQKKEKECEVEIEEQEDNNSQSFSFSKIKTQVSGFFLL